MSEKINGNQQSIGIISSTESMACTTTNFYFLSKSTEPLGLFDVVKVEHKYKDSDKEEKSFTFGMITGISNHSDAPSHYANFISCDFGELLEDGSNRRNTYNIVTATFLKNDNDVNTPPSNGELVYKCSKEEVGDVLFGDIKDEDAIPFGYLKMYHGTMNVGCKIKKQTLLGPNSVHMNIAGVSGRAAKTTSTMCVLSSIQKQIAAKAGIAIVIFNVKGEDLLSIDLEPKIRANRREGTEYAKCFTSKQEEYEKYYNIFENVTYFYPKEINKKDSKKDSVQDKSENKKSYYAEFANSKENLDLIFMNDPDNYGTTESVVNYIKSEKNNIGSWNKIEEKLNVSVEVNGIQPKSFQKCLRLWHNAQNRSALFKDNSGATIGGKIDINEISGSIKTGTVNVIDIHTLNEYEQIFVVGSVTRQLLQLKAQHKEEDNAKVPKKIIIFADELNKFAPKTGGKLTPIGDILVDICARGRTDGIILFSAEQFPSQVNDQIIGNSAVRLFGYMDTIELGDRQYSMFSEDQKKVITGLKNGDCLLYCPDLVTPLKVHFPYPIYKFPKE